MKSNQDEFLVEANNALAGKTIKKVTFEEDRIEEYFVIECTDGTKALIRYDYFYEGVIDAN